MLLVVYGIVGPMTFWNLPSSFAYAMDAGARHDLEGSSCRGSLVVRASITISNIAVPGS